MSAIIVKIKKTVIEDIISFAKANYPREFFAYLDGKIGSDFVEVTGLAYHPFESSNNSAITTYHMGTHIQGFVGSVHSHPSGVNYPSNQDKRSFSKEGGVHIIISKPFTNEMIKCFDYQGNEVKFKIV